MDWTRNDFVLCFKLARSISSKMAKIRRQQGAWSDDQITGVEQDCQMIMHMVEQAIGTAENSPPVDWNFPFPKPRLELCRKCDGSGLAVIRGSALTIDEL